MSGKSLSSLMITVVLLAVSAGRALPAEPATTQDAEIMQQQINLQSRMLLAYLRRAMEAGVSGDPWDMDYALQQASRLSKGLQQEGARQQLTEPIIQAYSPGDRGKQDINLPLEEGLDIDDSLPSGRWQQLDEQAQEEGSIPLKEVSGVIDRAHQFLQSRPPALGAALMATNEALGKIHWRQGIEPLPWVKARDQLLKAYALALDSKSEAFGELQRAHDLLAGLPDGQNYARYLADQLSHRTADVRALRSLLRQVATHVATLRDTAEQTRFDRMRAKPNQP